MTARLITNPLSPASERARWALDRRGVPYMEECHLPTLQGRGQQTPVLVAREAAQLQTLTDGTGILCFADRVGRRGDPLFPANPEVATLEARLAEALLSHARRLTLFFLLDDVPALHALIAQAPVAGAERAGFASMLRLLTLMLRRSVDVGGAAVGRSRALVQGACDEVTARLADGRRFLAGDTFTAADLTFAALMAPLVLPPAYEAQLVPHSAIGAPWQRDVDGWRATRAGQYAMALFSEQRDPSMSDR